MVRRRTCSSLAACAALLLWTSLPVRAVTLFLDTGGPGEGVQGGPLDLSNPVLTVDPTDVVSLHLWAIPELDDAKTVASLSYDIVVSGSAASFVSAVQYEFDNPVLGDYLRWSGAVLSGGLNVASTLVQDQRAVFVPTAAALDGGIGSAVVTGDPGYDANSGAVHLGRIDVHIDAYAPGGTAAELRLRVGPLLICQVTEGTWEDEPVYFGYTPAGPEAATGTGSQEGATSATADAVIQIVYAGADFDKDGDVDIVDYEHFADCFSGPGNIPSPSCQECDLDHEGDVDLRDFAVLQAVFTG